MNRHPNDMSREELRELVSAMSWAALDLSQHLNFTNACLRDDMRQAAYVRAEQMAGEICNMPYTETPPDDGSGICVFGVMGLERIKPDAPPEPRGDEF